MPFRQESSGGEERINPDHWLISLLCFVQCLDTSWLGERYRADKTIIIYYSYSTFKCCTNTVLLGHIVAVLHYCSVVWSVSPAKTAEPIEMPFWY